MPLGAISLTPQAHPHIWRFRLEMRRLLDFARNIQAEGGQLLALWGSDDRQSDGCFYLHTAFFSSLGLIWASTALAAHHPAYPDLAAIFPQASRMQRATFDLLGLRAEGAADTRKWLRHGAWPADYYPLRWDAAVPPPSVEPDQYPFVRVSGEGVHEIPVGPIHAGTIEPGHFRFSVIGDRVLRLEERLGYTHKGIGQRFMGLDVARGARLAGRVSGDSHTAYTWAYCMAVESATGSTVPPRALGLRALFLEIERVANHLGDLGYLGNDVALSLGFTQFWCLKENWLRLTAQYFGHRYLYDRIIPGGVAVELSAAACAAWQQAARILAAEITQLQALYTEHAGLQDRFAHTGTVPRPLALQLGLTGLAGRANGQAWDIRAQFPVYPYDQLEVQMVVARRGDVLARAEVRFGELQESLRWMQVLLDNLPAGPVYQPLTSGVGEEGIGWVEGWRGQILVALRLDATGHLAWAYPHDPSWQNWPLLEVGILGNIVPDFPLINKSFNLSYSGVDL